MSYNSNNINFSCGESKYIKKEQKITNYRLTNNNEWMLVSDNKRHSKFNKSRFYNSDYSNMHRPNSSEQTINHHNNTYQHYDAIKSEPLAENQKTQDRVYDSESLKKQLNDNFKKILCKNITNSGKCIYNNKCLYAHGLEEQKIEPIRTIAYNMIKTKDDLSHIDLYNDKELYDHLKDLSHVCQSCNNGTCTGGYNCKHGACDKIYVICQTDLNKGTCDNVCGKIHLTINRLMPYGECLIKNMKSKTIVPSATIINADYFNNQNIKKTYSESVQYSMKNHFKNKTINTDIDTNCDDDIPTDVPMPTKSTTNNDWNIHDNCSDIDSDEECFYDSKNMDIILNLIPVKIDVDGIDLNLDTGVFKNKKLTTSIFKVDVLC